MLFSTALKSKTTSPHFSEPSINFLLYPTAKSLLRPAAQARWTPTTSPPPRLWPHPLPRLPHCVLITGSPHSALGSCGHSVLAAPLPQHLSANICTDHSLTSPGLCSGVSATEPPFPSILLSTYLSSGRSSSADLLNLRFMIHY